MAYLSRGSRASRAAHSSPGFHCSQKYACFRTRLQRSVFRYWAAFTSHPFLPRWVGWEVL